MFSKKKMKSSTSLSCNSLMPKDSRVPNSFLVQVREKTGVVSRGKANYN